MDSTTDRNSLNNGGVARGPAFSGVRWPGWSMTAIAIVCFIGFIVAQLGLLVWILFRSYPDLMRSPVRLQQDLADPSFLINLLTAKNLWLTSVGSEAVLGLMTIGFAQLAFRATPAQLGLGDPPKGRWVLWGIGVGISLVIVSSAIEAIIKAAFGSHPQPQALILASHHGTFAFLLDLMSVSIAAPVAEELFFRGFIFTGLVQRMSPVLAMAISATLFGLAHWEAWSFLSIFAIGCGLAWIYYVTKSLWVNIVAHATVNTISLVIAYALPQYIK